MQVGFANDLPARIKDRVHHVGVAHRRFGVGKCTTARTGRMPGNVDRVFDRDPFAAGLTVINVENWAAFGHLTGKGLIGADVEQRLLAASRTSAADLAHAEKVRTRFILQVDAALEEFAVLLLPTMPSLPPTLIEARSASKAVAGMTPLVRPFNLSGHPALTVPVELEGSGLKVGLQIVGRKGQDELVCAFGAQLQQSMAGERSTPNKKS